MLNTPTLTVAAVAAAMLVAGCGSSGGSKTGATSAKSSSPMSRAQYAQRLHAVAAQEAAAQLSVRKAAGATSVAQLRKTLSGFVGQQKAIAQELGALRPPADAVAANQLLAKGFGDNAAATAQALASIKNAASPKTALATLGRSRAGQSSGQEIDDALGRLKKLGYTKGS